MRTIAIIAAAGDGKRFCNSKSKMLASIMGKTLLSHTLDKFESIDKIDEIILLIRPQDRKEIEKKIIEKNNYSKIKSIVFGGVTRQESVYNGLMAIEDSDAIVLIHDGARPFIDIKIIDELLKGLDDFDGIIPAIPIVDTVKKLFPDKMMVEKTVDRNEFWKAQTPQVFRIDKIKNYYKKAMKENIQFTDDSALLEYYGGRIAVIRGSENNIKITNKVDLLLARIIHK